MSNSKKSKATTVDIHKLLEALKLAREAERVYANDWNGLKVKAVREKLEEALHDLH